MSNVQEGECQAIESFVEHWPNEIGKYERLAKRVEAICTKKLEIDKIRHNIRSRSKAQKDLRDSIKRRQQKRTEPYQSWDEIKHDLIDLAGVRIALTFPNDTNKVREMIETAFDPYLNPWNETSCEDSERSIINRSGIKREHKNDNEWPLGLKSVHFRCKLKEDDEGFAEFKDLAVEVQVGTSFMYAWEDVYHDIVYKPFLGEITPEEERFIEILNGLAHTAELALKQLRASLTLRLEMDEMPFRHSDHFIVWLQEFLSWPRRWGEDHSIVRNADYLHDILVILRLNKPAKLKPVIASHRDSIFGAIDPHVFLFVGRDTWWNRHPIELQTKRQQNLILAVMHTNARHLARYSEVFLLFGESGLAEKKDSDEKAFDLDVPDNSSSDELFNSWRRVLVRWENLVDLSDNKGRFPGRTMDLSLYIQYYELAFELACRRFVLREHDSFWDHGSDEDNDSYEDKELTTLVTCLYDGYERLPKRTSMLTNLCYQFAWSTVWNLDSKESLFDYDSLTKYGTVYRMLHLLDRIVI